MGQRKATTEKGRGRTFATIRGLVSAGDKIIILINAIEILICGRAKNDSGK